MTLMLALVALAGAAMNVVESEVGEKAEKMRKFMMCKTGCIASVCLLEQTVSTV